MPNFQVRWVRRYYTAGVIVVEADNADEAHDSVMDNLDEITSSMQAEDMHTYTDGDDVEVIERMVN
jgi:glutathionylspermidine synthase